MEVIVNILMLTISHQVMVNYKSAITLIYDNLMVNIFPQCSPFHVIVNH